MTIRRALALLPALFLLACSTQSTNSPSIPLRLEGNLHGGQQPVSGSSIQLYAVGLSGGGSTSTALLSSPAVSDGSGNFTITGTYSCPTAGSQVYVVARGGNPGLTSGTNNSAIALAAALGPCGNLSASTFINIDEVTTVALANTLAPFFGSITAVGSTATDATLLNAAFAMANRFASTTAGTSPGSGVPSGDSVPAVEINSLANILAACVNTPGGAAGDGSVCGNLFSLTTATGLSSPTDTFTAAIRLADTPTLNTAALFNLIASTAPFQPQLSAAPVDFSVALNVTGDLQVSQKTLAFGSSAVGTSAAPQQITLTNAGTAAIAISSVATTGLTPNDFAVTNNCPASLNQAQTCTMQVSFNPAAAGRRSAALAIGNGGAITPILVGLSGVGTSAAVSVPTLSAVTPASVPIGSSGTVVTATGTGFTSGTILYLNGSAQSTTYITPQSVSFVLSSAYTSYATTYSIYARNSAGNSNTLTLPVVYPVPVLTFINPSSVIAGAPNFTLSLTGSGFTSGSTVLINGVSRSINYISATSITAIVNSTEVAASGTLPVTVSTPTPGGGTSSAQQLQVIATDNRVRQLNYYAADIAADPARSLIYASLPSSSSNSVVAIDPAQGAIVTTQSVASTPDRIAVSDDGSYLYVSLTGSPSIQRLRLPSLTPDISWTLTSAASDLAVAPGAPHTVAVSVAGSLTVYDDGVARTPLVGNSQNSTTFDTITYGATPSSIYATRSGISGGPEFSVSVNASGPSLSNTFSGAFGDFLKRLTYNSTTNHLYDGYGNVVDPASGSRIGLYNIQNTLSYEQNAVAVDTVNSRAFILNENYFNTQNSSLTADLQAFDLTGYQYLNALSIQGLSGNRIVRWGSSGLAIGGGTKIFLVDGSFVSASGPGSPVGGYAGVSPTINSLTPQVVNAGDGPVNVVITGKNITAAAVATWNSYTLPVTYQSSTQVTVTFPASYLATPVSASLTLTNGPGTESSNAVPFVVLPGLGPNTQITALGVSGEDMAWDAKRGLLYIAVTSPTAANGNSIVSIDPSIPAIKNVVSTGYQPSALGISDDDTYLYAGFQTQAAVNRYALSDFSLNLAIPLTQGGTNNSFAGEVKVAPGQNQTIAVSMGTSAVEPRDGGGLVIFDNAIPRANTLPRSFSDTYKLSWGQDSTRLYAQSDPEFQPQSFSVMSVNSTGITGQSGGSGQTNLALRPHYDPGTNRVYSDGGRVSDPATGAQVGSLSAGGLMVPDSSLSRAFVLSSGSASGTYVLSIYDLVHETLLKTIAIPAISGYPTQLLRWGAQGVAILTDGPGMLYILQGSDISGVTGTPSNGLALSPSTVVAGAASGQTVTVSGSGFLPTSVVLVNGTQQPTTYVSASQVTFQVTAAEQAFARYLSVEVSNAATGGSASASSVLEVDNPVPAITNLGSTTLKAGSAASTLTVTGTGFTPSSVVRLNGTALTTSYTSSTSLSAALSATNLAAAGFFNITVYNPTPGGGVSATSVLEVDNPAPTISSLSPSTVPTGTGNQAVYIYGTGFTAATTISIQGTPATATYSSPTAIAITLPASSFVSPGSVTLMVTNPAPGGGSVSASVAVTNGVPTIGSLSPNTVLQGSSSPATIAVTGTNFMAGSVVQISGQSRTTTYVSSTQLNFVLTVADQATAGTRTIAVVNPTPNGGTSGFASLTVAVASSTPVVSSTSPSQFTLNGGASYLYVYASNLTSTSVIQWNGTSLTSYSSASSGYVYALVPASLLGSVGTASITVVNATATPPASAAVSVSIVAPSTPTVTSISPATGPINTAFTATVTGTNFTTASTVLINGDALPTTFVSSTQLTASVPATEVVLGNDLFTVSTPAPGGGASAAVAYTAYVSQVNNSMVYNPVDGFFYLSVPSSAGAPYGNSIVSLDPVTGALGTPIAVGSEPNRLALTSDGRYLWVGLDGAGAVRKVDLVNHAAGLQFALPAVSSSTTSGGTKATALVAVPGQTDSVVVDTGSTLLSIFDAGVLRGSSLNAASLALQIDGTRNEIYSAFNTLYQTFTYSSTGLAVKTSASASSALSQTYDQRIQTVGGRTYADLGGVLDAESGAAVGTFATSSTSTFSVAIDSSQSLAFVLGSNNAYATYPNQIQAFNTTTLAASGTATIPVSFTYVSPVAPATTLTRWGANGLAFRTAQKVYALRSNLVKDLSTSNADLAVSLAANGANTTGSSTTYLAQVANQGPASATETRLTAMPPSTGVVTAVSSTSGTCIAGNTVMCDLGTLASGTTATVTMTVSQLSAGTGTMTVSAGSSENDPNPANNQASSVNVITGATYSVTPTLSSLSPATVLAGSSDSTITITGRGFTSGSVAQLDGAAISTTFTSATQLSAVVPSASVASLGWHAITVTTPAPGGGVSSVLPLTVYAAIKASANNLAYDPFGRQLIASLGSGTPSGNSLEFINPATGAVSPSVSVGSEPTRLALSDDGQIAYVLLSGANRLQRYNMLSKQLEGSLTLTPPLGSTTSATYTFAIQPGSETTLALSTPPFNQGSILDYNPTTSAFTSRASTTNSYALSTPRFLNASTVLGANYGGTLDSYSVTASGFSGRGSVIVSAIAPFTIQNSVVFTNAGAAVDYSAVPVRSRGTFPVTGAVAVDPTVVPDLAAGRAYFLVGYDGTSVYNTYYNLNGIVAFDTNTFLPSQFIPLSITAIDGSSASTPVTILRWGQDGLAALTSSGTIYLVRGPAVLPQLLQSSSPPMLAAGQSLTLQHGSGNSVLTLKGSNFLPGIAVLWNGSFRTTTYVDSGDLTVDIPAGDLATAGSATVTAGNPGSSQSAALTVVIN